MRPRRRHTLLLLPAVRGCVALMALLGYLACSIGFPAPAPSPARESASNDEGRPAACRGHACGCTGTDHCCCCSQQAAPTPQPPPEKSPPSEDEACPLCSAGSEDPGDTGCSSCAAETTTDSCCAAEEKAVPPRTAEPPSKPAVVWVVGFQLRHCRGLDTLWYTFGAVLPLSAPVTWAYDWKPAGWLVSLAPLADSAISPPPTPPPRV
jgi:hypothetical protein